MDGTLAKAVLSLLRQGTKQEDTILKGAKKIEKAIKRREVELVTIASDTSVDIIQRLEKSCQENNLPYLFVAKSIDLGRALACGTMNAVAFLNRKDTPISE